MCSKLSKRSFIVSAGKHRGSDYITHRGSNIVLRSACHHSIVTVFFLAIIYVNFYIQYLLLTVTRSLVLYINENVQPTCETEIHPVLQQLIYNFL